MSRNMELLEDFSFIDGNGRVWTAKTTIRSEDGTEKPFIIDGATIPKLFQTPLIFGTPYVGNYRRASVVHDYYCKDENKHLTSSHDVHYMFYEASKTDKVQPWKRELMYLGLRIGGDKW